MSSWLIRPIIFVALIVLGTLHASYGLDHATKTLLYYKGIAPWIAVQNIKFFHGIWHLMAAAVLSKHKNLGVFMTIIAVLGTIALAGNPFVPHFSNDEIWDAITITYQCVALIGGAFLVASD